MADVSADIDAGKRPIPRGGAIAGTALFSTMFLMLILTGEQASYEVANWAPDCSGDVYALDGEPLLPLTA